MSPGVLDPSPHDALTGEAAPGAIVRLSVDGRPLAEIVADRRRLHPAQPEAGERAGFRLPLPEALKDGAEHRIEASGEDGAPLRGSPLRFRSRAYAGRIDGVAGNLIYGRARDGQGLDRTVPVVALAGESAIAVAVAKPGPDSDADGHVFRLILPEDLLRTGIGYIHVGVVGSDVRFAGSPALLPAAPPLRPAPRPVVPRPVTLAIKIAAPNLKVAHEWGDFHFANALGAALHKRGWIVRTDCADAWDRTGDDVTLTLRGRHRYKPKPGSANLLWIISHPDRLRPGEADSFDHIFVAASPYAKTLARTTRRPVETLHQATDPAVFTGEDPVAPPAPLLFVGNSRREYRRMVRWCVEEDLDLAVYGTLWEGLIPERLIQGAHIPNEELGRWYAGAGAVLNDHWDTMLSGGFLSNRLFDASAAGAFIITDPVAGLAEVFGDSIETADSGPELAEKVRLYAAEPERARAKAEAARALVLAAHTFDHRADVIERVALNLLRARGALA